MRTFIAWSDNRGQRIAQILQNWLPLFCQTAQAWTSESAPGGENWLEVIRQQLSNADTCIVCVTPESIQSHWIHFEAGALFPGDENSRILPLLFDVQPDDLLDPFRLLKAYSFDREGFVTFVNRLWELEQKSDKPSQDVTKQLVEKFWDELNDEVSSIMCSFIDARDGLWGEFLKSKRIKIYYSIESSSSKTVSATTFENELQAIVELLKLPLTKEGASTELVVQAGSSSIKELESGSQILIGGPNRNEESKRIISEHYYGDLRFESETTATQTETVNINTYLEVGGEKFWVKYGELFDPENPSLGRFVLEDYGIAFMSKRNGVPTLVLAGCHALGTHAAAIGMTNPDTMNSIFNSIKDQTSPDAKFTFLAVFKAQVQNNVIRSVELIDPVKIS